MSPTDNTKLSEEDDVIFGWPLRQMKQEMYEMLQQIHSEVEIISDDVSSLQKLKELQILLKQALDTSHVNV